jgi:hypothetical protein
MQARLEPHKSSSKPAWVHNGMPKQAGAYADIGPAVAYVVDAVNQIQNDAERDNKFVYFQPVPGPYSTNSSTPIPLPDLPPEACVMNPPLFKEPDRGAEPPVGFEYKAKPSIFSSMFSSLVGTSTSTGTATATGTATGTGTAVDAGRTASGEGAAPPAVASAPPAAALSADEEYARTLQRQYDAERQQQQQLQQQQQKPPSQPQPPSSGGSQPPSAKYNSLV